MKKFEKFITPGGCKKLHFLNNGSECLFMLYLIIVFNNEELGYFSKTRTGQQIHGHFKLDIIILEEKNWQPLTCHLIEVTPP